MEQECGKKWDVTNNFTYLDVNLPFMFFLRSDRAEPETGLSEAVLPEEESRERETQRASGKPKRTSERNVSRFIVFPESFIDVRFGDISHRYENAYAIKRKVGRIDARRK